MNARTCMSALMLLCCLHVAAVEQDAEYSMLDGVGRGFANLLTGTIEVPRCVTFYSVQWPVIGFLPGVLQGSGMTAVRAFGGVLDLLTLGYLSPGNTLYDAMEAPLFPWQAPWLPRSDDDIASCVRESAVADNC